MAFIGDNIVIDRTGKAVLSNATVTASGSLLVKMLAAQLAELLVNVTGAVSGTLQFSIAEVDPGNGTPVIGQTVTGAALAAAGTQRLALPLQHGGSALVSWVSSGGSFAGTYASVVGVPAPGLDVQSGVSGDVSAVGAQKVAEAVRLVGNVWGSAAGGVDQIEWTPTLVGSGTQAVAGNQLTLDTGLTANSSAAVQSAVAAPFVTGQVNNYLAGARVADTGVANNVREWGVRNAAGTDALLFRLSGTALQIVVKNNGAETVVAQASWNGSPFVLDTNHHIWEIQYTGGSARFYVDRILVHRFTAATSSLVADLNLGIYQSTANSGGLATSQPLIMRGTSISRIGQVETPRVAQGEIQGFVTTSATTEAVVRATGYTEQASDVIRSLSSTSAADTAAGTGLRTVRVVFFRQTGTGALTGPFVEDVVLNGVTPVNTVNAMRYFQIVEGLTAGTGGVAAGTIQVFAAAAGAGGVIASIAVGRRRTAYCHRYVASGRTLFLSDSFFSSTAGSANQPGFSFRALDLGSANAAERVLVEDLRVQGSGEGVPYRFDVPQKVVGPARVTAYVTPDNAASQINSAAFGFFEV